MDDKITSALSSILFFWAQVTPERVVKSKLLMAKLEALASAGRLTRIVVDEAHCASQWGHDFRNVGVFYPSYLCIFLYIYCRRVGLLEIGATTAPLRTASVAYCRAHFGFNCDSDASSEKGCS